MPNELPPRIAAGMSSGENGAVCNFELRFNGGVQGMIEI
jgi:hypothetical protein